MADCIKVAVRVRPFNGREKGLKCKPVIRMEGNTTYLLNPETGKERSFAFDYSFSSLDSSHSNFIKQQDVFDRIGSVVLKNSFEGYNCTIFAYGQTGAGKSFTMVGGDNNDGAYQQGMEQAGLIPRLCSGIFEKVDANTSDDVTFNVEASMMEIYNEKLHDLLNPENYGKGYGKGAPLRIRESPTLGPYVEGLTTSAVKSYTDLSLLMATGTRNRTIGATSMNHNSSRAHTIVTVVVTQTVMDRERMMATDKVSRINLVDLAGSERQGKAESTGDRLKEGCAINKSLSALGKCITMIAAGSGTDPESDQLRNSSYSDLLEADPKKEKEEGGRHKRKGDKFIPYRDSALTWLLSESLGGNAKTFMVAAISPADFNYAETLSTLRYAWQAKQIKNRAVVNEDPNERLIRELRDEIILLRAKLSGEDLSNLRGGNKEQTQEELAQAEEMIANLNKSWEQRLKETAEKLRGNLLSSYDGGIDATQISGGLPYLLNLHEDPTLSKNLAYPIKSYSVFGSNSTDELQLPDALTPPDNVEAELLRVKGVGIQKYHCVIQYQQEQGEVLLSPINNARVCHNGLPIPAGESRRIEHNDRVVLGMNHVFVVSFIDSSGEMTPRRATPADWAMAMEEMLAGMQQKFFDPNAKQVNEAELNQKMGQIREKEVELEKEKQKYEKMLQDIEVEYGKFSRKKEAKMNNRVKELEARLASEGRLGDLEKEKQRLVEDLDDEDLDQLGELDVKKKRLLEQSEAVDAKLESQTEKIKIFKRTKEKEAREVARAEEHIMELIPYVDEANIMSEHLDKGVYFEVRLHSSVSPEIYEDPVTGETMHKTEVEAGVSVTEEGSQQTMVWNYDKFMTRLYLMREIYERFQDEEEFVTAHDQDPFLDQSEAVEIGKAHLWMMGLSHLIDTEDTIPIISKNGDNEGKVSVKVLVANPQGRTESGHHDNVDGIDKLLGKRLDVVVELPGCKNINQAKYSEVYARFRFFDDPDFIETRVASTKRSNAPPFRFRKHITISQVDQTFINYLNSDALTVELWGNPVRADRKLTRTNTKESVLTSSRRGRPRSSRASTSSRNKPSPRNGSRQRISSAPDEEVVLLTSRLEVAKEENEKLRKDMDVKVEERTQELNSRVEQLTGENERLKAELERLQSQSARGPAKRNNITSPVAAKRTPRSARTTSPATRPSSRSTSAATKAPSAVTRKKPSGSVASPRQAAAVRSSRGAQAAKARLEEMKKKYGGT